MTDEQIDTMNIVIDSIDFDKIQKTMEILNWKWAFPNRSLQSCEEYRVPDVFELKQEARRILKFAIKEKCPISTGGFEAIYKNDGKYESIGLKFVLEEWVEINKK